MGNDTDVDIWFRLLLKDERERRGWSQAEMARLLTEAGLPGIYPTTVAKMEAGDRAVRLGEAAAIARLLETSLDSLVGETAMSEDAQQLRAMEQLLDVSRQVKMQTTELRRKLNRYVSDFFTDDDGYAAIRDGEDAIRSLEKAEQQLTDLDGSIAEYYKSRNIKQRDGSGNAT